MKDMAREAANGAQHGALILAEMQTAGRGRGTRRTWTSRPKGNLYFTLLLRASSPHQRPEHDKETMVTLHYAVTVAVARACRRAGVDARIKWPNDIWVNGKKISGIMIDILDSASAEASGLCVMVGVGINVHEDMTMSTDATISTKATSLHKELSALEGDLESGNKLTVRREALLGDILNLLEESLESCIPVFAQQSVGPSDISHGQKGRNRLIRWYRQLDMTIGHCVKVMPRTALSTQDQQSYYATALDFDDDGRLIVEFNDENGNIRRKHLSSAVVSIRPDCDGKDNDVKAHNPGGTPPLCLRVYNGPGADMICVAMTMRSLYDICDPHRYKINIIKPEELRTGLWRKGCAAIVFPGGADRLYMKELEGEGNQQIHQFVHVDAGCYLGICAGAYYGCANVMFDVGGPLEVQERRELCFYPGNAVGPVFPGFDYASESGARAAWLNTDDTEKIAVYFNGGCFFEDCASMQSSEVKVVARYSSKHSRETGSEMAAALVLDKVGHGVAVLCGVHPEFIPTLMIEASGNVSPSSDRESMLQTLACNDVGRVKFLESLLSPVFDKHDSTK